MNPRLSRAINFLAMAQLLTFDHVLGNHTFIDEIQLLPPGSILTLSSGKVNNRTYWQLEFPQNYTLHSQKDYQEELLFLLRQSIARQKPERQAGIMLSGGLDSRVLLALLSEMSLSTPPRTFTFGNRDSDDVRYARELASKTNVSHQYYPIRPDYLLQHAENGVKLTDGMENVIHMHTLDNLSAQATQAPIIYKGFLGDALTGYFSYRDLLSPYAVDDLTRAFLERYPIVFDPVIHTQLFTPAVSRQLEDRVLQTAHAELTLPGSGHLAADLFFQFDLRQRQRRLTLNGVSLVRSQAIVRTPFYDNDLLDFMLGTPQGYRLERFLIIQTFIAAFPELSKIPSTADGYPLMPCLRDSFMHLSTSIRWRLRAAGLKWVNVPQTRRYASYNLWFRGALRSWIEGILQSDSFQSRGFFNQAYIRQLLNEHMGGQNHEQKLGALISIELWHRQFID